VRTPLLALLVVAACQPEHRRHAIGSLAFEPGAIAGDPSLFLATEAEIIRGPRIRQLATDRFGAKPTAPVQIEVTRRDATAILDVAAYADDLALATRTCNAVLKTYADSRLDATQSALMARIQALDEAGKGAERDALMVEQRLQRNDVRLLEPCVVR
jgi:hypothetical protein